MRKGNIQSQIFSCNHGRELQIEGAIQDYWRNRSRLSNVLSWIHSMNTPAACRYAPTEISLIIRIFMFSFFQSLEVVSPLLFCVHFYFSKESIRNSELHLSWDGRGRRGLVRAGRARRERPCRAEFVVISKIEMLQAGGSLPWAAVLKFYHRRRHLERNCR